MEPVEILPAQCVILEEFLPPLELESLIQDTLRRESEFHVSEVISPGVNGGMADFEHRRSRVLLDIGTHGAALAASGRDGAGDESPRSDFAGHGEEDYVVASGRDHRH